MSTPLATVGSIKVKLGLLVAACTEEKKPDPPVEKNGSVIPVIGSRPRFTLTLITKCAAKYIAKPPTAKRENRSRIPLALPRISAIRST